MDSFQQVKVIDFGGIQSGYLDPDSIYHVYPPDDFSVDISSSSIKLIYGSGDVATNTSSVTTQGNYNITYHFDDLRKIPHDFVQASISRVIEGQKIEGMTPDIVIEKDGEVHVYEISTTRSCNMNTQRDDVLTKLNKYRHLFRSGRITTLSAISISRIGVCSNLTNHHEILRTIGKSIEAYKIGLKLLGDIADKINLPSLTGENVALRSKLSMKNWPTITPDGREDQCFIDEEYMKVVETIDPTHSYNVNKNALKQPEVRMDKTRPFGPDNIEWFRSRGRVSRGAVAAIPVFMVSDHCVGVSENFIDTGHGTTAMMAINPVRRHKEDLRLYAEMKPEVKNQMNNEYTRLEKLTKLEQMDLAKRGVMAKSMSTDPVLQHYRREKSIELDPTQDVSQIEEWIDSEIKYVDDTNYKIPKRFGESIMKDGTKLNVEAYLNLMIHTDLISSISNFQRILSEVILEMKMNPRDHGDYSFFIVKPIDNDISVIIRTTRYGGESESHTFYQVVCHKPVICYPGIFEQFYPTRIHGMYATKFCSITRERAAHYLNICEQIMSIWFLLLEEIGVGIKPEPDLPSIRLVSKTLRYLTLILLEGKEYTSRNLQQLRYYYMDVLSTGGPNDKNWKFLSKLDSHIRSKLFIYTMKSLRDIHFKGLIHVTHEKKNDEELQPDNDDQPFEEQLLKSNETHELTISVPTPAKYTATTMQQLLLMMYSCVLHNKDESEYMLSAKQIVSKLVKLENELPQCEHVKGDISINIDTTNYKSHDWSLRMVKAAALKMKHDLELIHGDLHKIAVQTMSETSMAELATTRSSHSGNNLEPIKNVEEIKERCKRTKCFIEYMRLSDKLIDKDLSGNIDLLTEKMEKENGNRVHVKMFKKNQIGGTREIMILDFTSRCMIRMLEDISRGLAQICELDMLTKPKLKTGLLRSHMRRNRMEEHNYTKRYSLDKTTWCQRFVNPIFYTLLSTLMPEFKYFFAYILNCHTRKRIELPAALIKSFMTSTHSSMDHYEVNWLFREFNGIDPEFLIGESNTTIKNCSNMMQGILHYTSTILHCAFMYYMRGEIERVRSKLQHLEQSIGTNNTLRVDSSIQVSSDDSGMIITLSLGSPDTKLVNGFFTAIEQIMWSVEPAFCMKTSIEKSTITTLPLYEFNSVFHSGNNLSSPLLKFVARSMDDQVHDSLKSRVDSMYSSLREVRSNGGTSMLCGCLGALQHLSLMNSFGLKTQDRFDELSDVVYDSKLSILGFYLVHPPILSGIFSTELSDYWMCKLNPLSLQMMAATRKTPDLLTDEDQVDRLVYRMWPSQRYHRTLASLNIDRTRMLESSFEEIKPLISQPESISEMNMRVKLNLLNYSISRCFAILSRTDNQFAQAYILWDKIYKVGDRKLTILQYKQLLESSSVKADLSIFPLRIDHDYYIDLTTRPLHRIQTGKHYTMHNQGYASMHSTLPTKRDLSNLILFDWYEDPCIGKRHAAQLRTKITQMFPWYDTNAEVALKRSGLQSPLQLLNFMNTFVDKGWGFNFISCGFTRSYRNVVEGLLPLNTARLCYYSMLERSKYLQTENTGDTRSELIRAFETRISDWNFLATCTKTNEHLQTLTSRVRYDIKKLVVAHESELEIGVMNPRDDFMRLALLSFKTGRTIYDAIRHMHYNQILYRVAQVQNSDGQWIGPGEVLYHTSRGSALVKFRNRDIYEVRATSPGINYEKLLLQLDLKLNVAPTILALEEIVQPPSDMKFHKGQSRCSLMIVDSSNKPILRLDVKPKISSYVLEGKKLSPLLDAWINRVSDPLDWTNLFMRDDVFRPVFIGMLTHVMESIRTRDVMVIGETRNEVIEENNYVLGDMSIDDYLFNLMEGLQAPDNGSEVDDNFDAVDFFDYNDLEDPLIYYQTDITRLLYHPFIQMFTTSTYGYLPGILGTIKAYLMYKVQTNLTYAQFVRFHVNRFLADEFVILIGDEDFRRYVSHLRTQYEGENTDEESYFEDDDGAFN